MTFKRGLFPMVNDSGCSKYARLGYNTPRTYDLKRLYPWLRNVRRSEITSNKKQAVEAPINRPDFMQRSVYPLDRASNYPLIPSQDQGEPVSRPRQFTHMVDLSLSLGGMSGAKEDLKNARQKDASADFHHPHEILKAKVNHVHGYENVMSAPRSNSFRKADDGRLLRTVGYDKDYGNFLTLGPPIQINDGSKTPVNVIENEGLDLNLTLGRNYKEDIIPDRADEEPKHASGMAIADNRVIVNYPNNAHLSEATSQTNTNELNAHQNNIEVYVIRKGGYYTLGCKDKNKGHVVLEGVKVTANDEAMIDNQNFALSLGTTSRVGTVEPNTHPSLVSSWNPTGNSNKQGAFKREKPKMGRVPHPNVYLSSVHRLLSTGLFDGAPVKYILRRRSMTLRGVIKGQKILCSCNECKNSKYISPSKFERHAGGRTKHPNTCIYFENGKTIHEVFQELTNTPEDMLFDAIPIIVGSAVSRPHFHLLKASYSAGPLEL